MERPAGVTYISFLFILGSTFLIFITFFTQQLPLSIEHAPILGISDFPEDLLRILLASIVSGIAYGYMQLKKWAYIGMIIFCLLSWYTFFLGSHSFFNLFGTLYVALTVIVMVYTLLQYKSFFKPVRKVAQQKKFL
ncbi:hypothetical protein M3603_08760 [Rummeliibacillus stabekisii]|uniref:hypothetical protein n=1 Tax=Rummeliibacillus stabekisii TaxID=241244 RepID=UPI00204066A0|nr:hypothetical protein [Rummeliibacillus stabekisii]MCM3316768.1 hypothetical protein [Rummeliibacillus stabekisii]